MEGWNASIAIALMIAAFIVMLVVELAWRHLSRSPADLPMWGFLRLAGILPADAARFVGAKSLRQAEVACTVCSSREECRRQLAAHSATMPPANCPNARLIYQVGHWTNQPRK